MKCRVTKNNSMCVIRMFYTCDCGSQLYMYTCICYSQVLHICLC